MLCPIDGEDTCDDLLDCLVGEIGKRESCQQRLPLASEEGIRM